MRLIMKRTSAEAAIKGLDGVEGAQQFLAALVDKVERLRATDAEIDLQLLEPNGLDVLEALARETGDRSVTGQLGTYRKILSNPREARISRLAHLEGALVEWILQDVTKGWIFRRQQNGDLQAWVVNDVRYTTGMHQDPHVTVSLSANAPAFKGEETRHVGVETINFYQKDLPASADELFGHSGWMHENDDLHAEYEEDRVRFARIHSQTNAQFRLAPGTYRKAGRNVSYSDRELLIGTKHRCINDETLVIRPVRDAAGRHNWDDRVSERPRGHGASKGPRAIPDEAFQEMPSHFLHLVFDLDAHEHAWAPPSALTEYVYQPEKVNLLVLPDAHRDLIDILTSDGDVLIEDVVEGKSGGTIILLEGKPGLGKTLLPEVYSEAMARPLYRVQAGQFGTTPESVEKGLALVYANAARWGAVVLIDEADVYIRVRDGDMDHNAVVSAMLVAFERQTAISFLCTNRSDDVDEAVISRCIAVVHFEMPTAENSKLIWRIQAEVVGVELSDEVIDEIIRHHRTEDGTAQRASGRDIRALLKLAYRYKMRLGTPITADLLKQLGAFKRL